MTTLTKKQKAVEFVVRVFACGMIVFGLYMMCWGFGL